MTSLALFTDVGLDPQRRLGVGGYLLVPASLLESDPHAIDRDELCRRIRSRTFVETSSTKLEVQTVLWALEDAQEEINASAAGSLRIYTDSQCVAGLLQRRAVLPFGTLPIFLIAKAANRPPSSFLPIDSSRTRLPTHAAFNFTTAASSC